jgi:hypothetical protein
LDIEWGDSISSEVRLALEEAAALLVIISPGSLKSHWVPYEIGYGSAQGKKILPYLTHPSLDVPGYIGDLKHLTNIDQVRAYFSGDFQAEPSTSALLLDNVDARFQKAESLMPDLFKEMREDLASDETHLTREFFLATSKRATFSSSKSRFRYNADEHDNLYNKIDFLVEYGLVTHIRESLYRMTEEFIGLLTSINESA